MYKHLLLKNESVEAENFQIAVSIMKRKLEELSRVDVVCEKEADTLIISLAFDNSLRNDAYKIEKSEDEIRISGGEFSGVLGGMGRLIIDGNFENGHFTPGNFEGEFTPRCDVVGTYYASHFNNYFQRAPLEEIYNLLEDEALWGQNWFDLWFDISHYMSFEDKHAKEDVARFCEIVKYAKKLGMRFYCCALANEGLASTPEELKAEWKIQGKYHTSPVSHYHVEICPNKPGGLELIWENKKKKLDVFKDCLPDVLGFGVYDQGGCTCPLCEPYGGNGLVKIFKYVLPKLNEYNPNIKANFSAWYMDKFVDGEWDLLYKAVEEEPEVFKDVLYTDGVSIRNGNKVPKRLKDGFGPGNTRALGFPEISMQYCHPYGGFGANPLPKQLQEEWDEIGKNQAGEFSYCEGIFTDLNIFIVLSMYSGRTKCVKDAVRDYMKTEISAKYADELTEIMYDLEETYERKVDCTAFYDDVCDGAWNTLKIPVEITHPAKIQSIAKRIQKIHNDLPLNIKRSFRWRLIYDRVMADETLRQHDFIMNADTEIFLNDLQAMYYIADNTLLCVTPPTRACASKRFTTSSKLIEKMDE